MVLYDGVVKITKTVLSFYVDDKECYMGPYGTLLFKCNKRKVAEYVVEQVLGRKLRSKEVVLFKDGNCTNVVPDNLLLVEQKVGESDKTFKQRCRRILGEPVVLITSIPLKVRVPDINTRPSTHPTLSVRQQVLRVQRYINKQRYTFEKPEVGQSIQLAREVYVENAKRLIARSYRDVRLTDLYFSNSEVLRWQGVGEVEIGTLAKERLAEINSETSS